MASEAEEKARSGALKKNKLFEKTFVTLAYFCFTGCPQKTEKPQKTIDL